MLKRNLSLGGFLAMSMLAACTQVEEAKAPGEELGRQAGMALTVDVLGGTDVARIAYTVTAVDCGSGEVLDPLVQETRVQDLEDAVLPGQNADLAGAPFAAGSQHLFADAFFWLGEGCYDVVAQPVQEDGSPSAECAAATQSNVAVFDGQTTEILLINQCESEGAGGLDIIAALNHAPQLEDVRYAPSKFICEDQTTICVVASDADNDPLQATFSVSGDGVVIGQTQAEVEGGVEFCATIQVGGPGDYSVTVVVQDLGPDVDGDGDADPIELLLGRRGRSRDEAVLPIHSLGEEACVGQCECPEGFTLNEVSELCERIQTVEAVQNGDFRVVCEGDRNINYGALGAIFPGGTVVTGGFFGDGTFSETNGSRLNTIGIWDCGGAVNEWIGFSRCVDIPAAGEYVVGISGDDFVRFRVNGAQVFENPAVAFHFRRWNMIPVTLQAGVNIVEMEGLDTGVASALGAEIYGPFPLGSTADDASMAALDYENNIVWSTGDQLGSVFNLGSISGFSCEEGFALDLCGDEATCTRIERLACE
jgi:hypothetical protein